MELFEQRLNELLTDTFRNVLKVEERTLRDTSSPLSISEIHLLEAVGNCQEVCTIRTIANALEITMASVTVAVTKLVHRGYLTKEKNSRDGRSVQVELTYEGKKIYRMHRLFHSKMVRAVSRGMEESEKSALLAGIEKLDKFFREKAGGGNSSDLEAAL